VLKRRGSKKMDPGVLDMDPVRKDVAGLRKLVVHEIAGKESN